MYPEETSIITGMLSSTKAAAQLIHSAKRCVVFSGAGMSKDSGIDVFRGSGNSGFWNGIFGKFALIYGGTPFGWNWTPSYVWLYFINTFLAPIAAAEPHAGYYALFNMSTHASKPFDVITMNVDGLHQASGFSEDHVIEVHGTLKRFRCISCANSISIPNPISTSNTPPRCPLCKGFPRPDVTLFTESLPEVEWERAQQIISSLQPGDVMIIVGKILD